MTDQFTPPFNFLYPENIQAQTLVTDELIFSWNADGLLITVHDPEALQALRDSQPLLNDNQIISYLLENTADWLQYFHDIGDDLPQCGFSTSADGFYSPDLERLYVHEAYMLQTIIGKLTPFPVDTEYAATLDGWWLENYLEACAAHATHVYLPSYELDARWLDDDLYTLTLEADDDGVNARLAELFGETQND